MTAFSSIALCLALVTICWTVVLLQKTSENRARFLIGMVGLVAVFLSLRLLQEYGIWSLAGIAPSSGVVDLLVAVVYFAALILLNGETTRHRATKVCLRLSEANEQPRQAYPDPSVTQMLGRTGENSAAAAGTLSATPETELRLESLIRHSPQPVIVLDDAGRVKLCNEAAARICNYQPEQMKGVCLRGLMAASPRQPSVVPPEPKPKRSGALTASASPGACSP